MTSDIQEPNHYIHTLRQFKDEWHRLYNTILFLEVSATIVPELKTVWDGLNSPYEDETWIPDNWRYLVDKFKELLKSPIVIDILRFRQIDMDTIIENDDFQYGLRFYGYPLQGEAKAYSGFLVELSKEDQEKKDFIDKYGKGDQKAKDKLFRLVKNKKFLVGDEDEGEDAENERQLLETYQLRALKKYIDKFEGASTYGELDKYLTFIGLTDNQKENLLKIPLDSIYGNKNEKKASSTDPFSDVTVEMLRERITTFNNLIVRLPVDSEHNCLASKRIFQDWKAFVDGAAKELVEHKKLFVKNKPIEPGEDEPQWLIEYGIGTNGEKYPYTELYVDEAKTIPLVDYSYIVIKDGKANFDRWDYWDESDFNWPQ